MTPEAPLAIRPTDGRKLRQLDALQLVVDDALTIIEADTPAGNMVPSLARLLLDLVASERECPENADSRG